MKIIVFCLYSYFLGGICSVSLAQERLDGIYTSYEMMDLKESKKLKDEGLLHQAYLKAFDILSKLKECSNLYEATRSFLEEVKQEIWLKGFSTCLFDEKLIARKPLQELLVELGYEGFYSLDAINDFMQSHFLRKNERWDPQELPSTYQTDRVVECLKDLHLHHEVVPIEINYDAAVVYGALLDNFNARLEYVVKLWDEGIRFKKIIFLGGKRDLQLKAESVEQFLKILGKDKWPSDYAYPQDEYEMMKALWDLKYSASDLKSQVEVIFVNTDKQKNPDGSLRRPNTDDTVQYWLNTYHPSPGKYLVVSNHIFIPRQDLVARSSLPKDFMIDTVGPESNVYTSLACRLDELTRLIYQTKIFIQKNACHS